MRVILGVAVALLATACGGRPGLGSAERPDPGLAEVTPTCEQRLWCNAPTCECPEGSRCFAPCDDCRADCVPDETAAASEPSAAARCEVCELQRRECVEHGGPSCAPDHARCQELCDSLAAHHDARPGGPCPCAPGLCCRGDRCERNSLVYFSPYEPTSDPVLPEDEGTRVLGVVSLCAIEGEDGTGTTPPRE